LKIYLAVGHGKTATGYDPGASGGGQTEQSAGDVVVKSAADTLRGWGVTVKDEAYQDDPNFSGTDDLVRSWGADLLVSVHHDWVKAPTGFFALWYKENGRILGRAIERAVANRGFALRSYPNAGYRDDLSILKTVGSIPNTLVECGRIGQYSTDQLRKLGVAIAYGIADYAGIRTSQEEPDMTEAEVRKIVRQEIDIISAPGPVSAAQQKLIDAGLLSSPRPSGKAASTDLVMLLAARLLDRSGVVDLSGYELVKK
jgi:hypothetical protein